jgi:hypothetical protein
LSSGNIDILKKNNVILCAVARYGFWEACCLGALQPRFQGSFILINLRHFGATGAFVDMKNGGIY